MSEPPTTRPSLLVRLRDPMDSRAWSEFVEIYGPLIRQLAATARASGSRRRRPVQGGLPGRRRGDRAV